MASPLGHVVVVGASLAGLQAAQAMRRAGYDGRLTMIGAEPHFPYDRPPLSKQYLAGEWDAAKLRLRGAVDPDEYGIDWMLSTVATGLDLESRSVQLGDDELPFDGLVISTGASPRTLPGTELGGVHVLRTLDDADRLLAVLDTEPVRVVVIGAGFIGAEVAATVRERGVDVTMIEAAPAPLARVLDEAAGLAIADLHRAHGVDVRLGVGVTSLSGNGTVERVGLSDGSMIDATLVVVGIGVAPNTGWLAESGLTIDDGVVCDSTCLAGPGVVAAGDVARWPNPRYGERLTRVEQWDNATEQGMYAGKRLLAWAADEPVEPFSPVPWFWSDQYDRKIQLAGLPTRRAELVHGSIEERRFVQLYSDDSGEFVGALAWNRPRHAIQARQLLASRASLSEAREALA